MGVSFYQKRLDDVLLELSKDVNARRRTFSTSTEEEIGTKAT